MPPSLARTASTNAARADSASRAGATTPGGPSTLTGSTSGSATPSTSYGSFPPAEDDVEAILRSKLGRQAQAEEAASRAGGPGGKRRWARSRERLVPTGPDGRPTDDVFDSDGDAEPSDGEGGAHRSPFAAAGFGEEDGGNPWGGTTQYDGSPRRARKVPPPAGERSRAAGGHIAPEGDKQWGVVKMELMARTWGRRGLFTIYAGCVSLSLRARDERDRVLTLRPRPRAQALPHLDAHVARGQHDPDRRALLLEPPRRALDAQLGRHRHVGASCRRLSFALPRPRRD